MSRTQNGLLRGALSTSIAVALGVAMLPGAALAQTEREAALEARVAELERMVQQLMSQQGQIEQQQTSIQERQRALDEQVAARVVPEGQQPVQATSVVPGANPGTKFGFGGFVKTNFIYNDFSDGEVAAGNIARDFYLPGGIPVGGEGEDPSFDAHAKQSRFWLTTETLLDNGSKLGSRFELDFAVPVGGDERNTNTYNPVLRRAYLTYDNWLAGQEWSNFMELGALPETTDFIGPTEGMVFVRQAQLRYTSGPFSVSLENPETTILPFGGGPRTVADDNTVPDLTARYVVKGSGANFVSIAGVLRELRFESGDDSESEFGGGISVSGKFGIGEADDIRFMGTYGSGIGRYVGLNFFEDVVAEGDGNLDPLDVFAAYLAYRHVWGGSWRSNIIAGYTEVDNDSDLTGFGANAKAQSLRANLMWSPVPKLDFGIELSTAKRELESGDAGELNRVDFMAKYTF